MRPCTAATATEVHAGDLTLDKFIDATTLTAAPTLPGPSAEVRTVLLTGATGFLGRYLALEWLQRMELVDGTLICLVRAKSNEDARHRLDKTFDSGDPQLLRHFQELAADHLEVIAGDKGEANLGLDQQTWQRLADTVDLIVDPAALVNGVLPYSELFGPNVVGTAELIRIALTTKLKPYTYVSTANVGDQIEPSAFTEDADIRVISPTRTIDGSYANGYGNSKWAGEVLLREANDLCGLPVTVFRCDMILADTTYAGQLNVSDMFTRMVLSLVATGIAPGSFYQLDADGNRQRAHFDGLPVEFVAEAIATLGAQVVDGFETYHVMNPHDDGIGLDEYVDWLIEAGYPIQRIDDFGEWLQRFETGLRALPDRQRQHSVLPMLLLRNSDSFTARRADARVLRADRPIPCCGARSENRPRQRHPARLGADHHQIRHRLATARALGRFQLCGPSRRRGQLRGNSGTWRLIFLIQLHHDALLRRVVSFLVCRLEDVRDPLKVARDAHQFLQDHDSLLVRLGQRTPGLLIGMTSSLFCVGDELFALTLGFLPRLVDRRLGFSTHPSEFGVELFSWSSHTPSPAPYAARRCPPATPGAPAGRLRSRPRPGRSALLPRRATRSASGKSHRAHAAATSPSDVASRRATARCPTGW